MPPVSRIFFICLPAPLPPERRSVGEYGLLEIQKGACSSSGWVSAVLGYLMFFLQQHLRARPSPNINTSPTVRNPNPCRLSFQTLRYVQRSNNPPNPSFQAPPPLSMGFDRAGHSCLLGTVAKLFTVQISQGRVEKVADEWNTWDMTWPFVHFHRANLCGGVGAGRWECTYEQFLFLSVFLLNL